MQKENPKKANTAKKPLVAAGAEIQADKGLKINEVKTQDYTRADQYLAKQKWEQTLMVFISYG